MGAGKHRWRISFYKSPPPIQTHHRSPPPNSSPPPIPTEFLCPLSSSLMADPVIVSSGHTFERNCALACVSLSFAPTLHGGAAVVFSAVIPNLALKSTILNWCRHHHLDPPKPLDFYSADKIVRQLIPPELTPTPSIASSSSSCDIEIISCSMTSEEDENDDCVIKKLKSPLIHEQEEALVSLRKLTRTREETRASSCTLRILSALKTLIGSRYSSLQVNATAVLVNLSLEKQNKVKIVRSGIVPPLIDVLRGGFGEAREHAAGALFSLSLDDHNKTAIGVLGALPPLLHALRSESERTRHDSALALYHLSLVHSNRFKLVKLGSVQILIGLVKSGHMVGRVMLVLCNLAASVDGRAAMLDGGAVECFVALLSRDEFDSVSTRESCVAALYGLSYGGLRFKGLAKEAGAEEVVERVEKLGSEHAKENCRRILEVMRERHEEDEDVNWAELLDLNDDLTLSRVTQSRDDGSNESLRL